MVDTGLKTYGQKVKIEKNISTITYNNNINEKIVCISKIMEKIYVLYDKNISEYCETKILLKNIIIKDKYFTIPKNNCTGHKQRAIVRPKDIKYEYARLYNENNKKCIIC